MHHQHLQVGREVRIARDGLLIKAILLKRLGDGWWHVSRGLFVRGRGLHVQILKVPEDQLRLPNPCPHC